MTDFRGNIVLVNGHAASQNGRQSGIGWYIKMSLHSSGGKKEEKNFLHISLTVNGLEILA